MALDHYVSQVHLKRFYSPVLGNLMYAIRKSDLREFTPNSEAVCRIDDGNTNPFLQEERAIEEFLKDIEPKYNRAVEKLLSKNIDSECIYTIAGFVSYILTCSPTAMRLKCDPLKRTVEETTRIVDAKEGFPPPPPELAGKSLTDLLDQGLVQVEIDPKYPQAIGIVSILSLISTFGNFKWDILINGFDDNPFFTSDYPVAIEETADPRILNKIIPLAPNIAIRIHTDLEFEKGKTDFSFSRFRYNIRKISRAEVIKINLLIVRCAESLVFFRDNYQWVPNFITRNARFRINPTTREIPFGKGTVLWFTQEITKTST